MQLSRTAVLGSRPRSLKMQPAHGARAATAVSAVKLYTNPGSRGKMAEWYLAELGNVQFEAVNLDMKKGEHKTAQYLSINPFGKVPAMTDGDLKLFESGAILLHLASKYGNVSGDALSTACMWVVYANATLSDGLFGPNKGSTTPVQLSTLDSVLGKSAYIAGADFSVSDVAVGAYLLYLPLFFPNESFTKYKNVWAYMQRISKRSTCPEAYQQAMKGK